MFSLCCWLVGLQDTFLRFHFWHCFDDFVCIFEVCSCSFALFTSDNRSPLFPGKSTQPSQYILQTVPPQMLCLPPEQPQYHLKCP